MKANSQRVKGKNFRPLHGKPLFCWILDSLLTVDGIDVTVNKTQTRFYLADGAPVNHDLDNLIQTQDLTPWYEENSNLYIFSGPSFASTNARIGKMPILHEMGKMEAVDIDTPKDWLLAEAVAFLHLIEDAIRT